MQFWLETKTHIKFTLLFYLVSAIPETTSEIETKQVITEPETTTRTKKKRNYNRIILQKIKLTLTFFINSFTFTFIKCALFIVD